MNFSELNQISSAFVRSRILQVAVKFGVFDAIRSEGSSSEELAKTLNTETRATELFLNSLVAIGILDKKDERFHNTQCSLTYLVKTSPKYFGGMILFEEGLWNVWEKLEASIRTGKPAKTPDMFQQKGEETEKFIMAMHSLVEARGDAAILSDILDFNWVRTMIDIGSGPGTYPIEFIRKYPLLEVTIFDLPGTLKVTRKVLEKEGIYGRINIAEGDYNTDPLPTGFDIAFLSNIIHSENEKANQELINKVFGCLNSDGKIIIKDHILDDSLTNPPIGAIFSIQMLLTTKGRDYSFTEVRRWMENTGFREVEWIRLEPPLTSSLVIGQKIA